MRASLLCVLLSSIAVVRCGQPSTDDLAASFRAAVAALAADAERDGTITVGGRNGWLFFGPELRHIGVGRFWGPGSAQVSRARQPENADPLPALVDFHQQLSAIGVELLVVPVPPKAIIYQQELVAGLEPARGRDESGRLDFVHREFYEELRRQGVQVLDLTRTFIDNREDPDGPLYCRHDTHWSGVGCSVAATAIAAAVRAKSWYDGVPKRTFAHEWRSVTISGDLWQDLADDTIERERLRLRRVGVAGAGELTPLEPDPASPVILLGDSHNLVFHAGEDMHATASGLPDQLALELRFAVDLVAVRGSGATAARVNLLRRAQRDPSYWTHKRLVIWCFGAREFTEADGWAKVPIQN